MLTVNKIRSNSIRYYTGQVFDYYHADVERPYAAWLGTGAAVIGLEGWPMDPATFGYLLAGFDPTGQMKWVQNAGKLRGYRRRACGYDCAFNAPKSVSWIWAVTSDQVLKAQIEAELIGSSVAVLNRIETFATIRRGRNGSDLAPCGLIVLAVLHHTARPVDARRPDPHLHLHCLVINTGIDSEGGTGALRGGQFYDWKKGVFAKYFGQQFRDRFAPGIESLGFLTRPSKHVGCWEVAGIPETELERVSSRERQIMAAAARAGTDARAQVIRTREAKREIPPIELYETWRDEALSLGFSDRTIAAIRQQRIETDREVRAVLIER